MSSPSCRCRCWTRCAGRASRRSSTPTSSTPSRSTRRARSTAPRARCTARWRRPSATGGCRSCRAVVAWQSVVDSTVGSVGVADRLFARLRDPKHRLVIFDLNRMPEFRGVARPAARALIERLERGQRGYTLDIVSNADATGARIGVVRLAPDGGREVRDTALDWPGSLVSLGHVALPFPPDDPVYGFVPGSGRDGIPSIGSWLLRGESGAITLSLGSLTRLRSNPFWPLIDADVAGLVAQDLAVPPALRSHRAAQCLRRRPRAQCRSAPASRCARAVRHARRWPASARGVRPRNRPDDPA